jgi:hypothetical protein
MLRLRQYAEQERQKYEGISAEGLPCVCPVILATQREQGSQSPTTFKWLLLGSDPNPQLMRNIKALCLLVNAIGMNTDR